MIKMEVVKWENKVLGDLVLRVRGDKEVKCENGIFPMWDLGSFDHNSLVGVWGMDQLRSLITASSVASGITNELTADVIVDECSSPAEAFELAMHLEELINIAIDSANYAYAEYVEAQRTELERRQAVIAELKQMMNDEGYDCE